MKTPADLKNGLKVIPSVFQYVWVGGEIKLEYMREMTKLAQAAAQDKFKVILWTDNEKNINKVINRTNLNSKTSQASYEQRSFEESAIKEQNYNSQKKHTAQEALKLPISAESLDISIDAKALNIEVRNINELLELIKTDPIFPDKETNEYIYNILKESIGHKNLAAVSDLVRYCSLYYYGGYYFDTDLKPKIDEKTKLASDQPALGIIGNFDIRYKVSPALQTMYKLYKKPIPAEIEGNNDCIGVIPRHPVMRAALKQMLNTYLKFEVEPLILKEFNASTIKNGGIVELNPFEETFINELSKKDNETIKTKFINSLLDLSFTLRMLNNYNEHSLNEKRTPEDIEQEKKELMKSIEKLIKDTALNLGMDITKYPESNGQIILKEFSDKLIDHVSLEVKKTQERYNFGYEKATEMDAKRYPYQQGRDLDHNRRRMNTCLAGVNPLFDALTAFLLYHDLQEKTLTPEERAKLPQETLEEQKPTYTPEEMARFPTERLTEENFSSNIGSISAERVKNEFQTIVIAGCKVELVCDKTWLNNEKKNISYDDSVLPSKSKHSFFAPYKVTAVKKGKEEDSQDEITNAP